MDVDIKHIYEQRLKVPERKLSAPFLLCPVGLVGAGKTTVVKPLSEDLSLLRISTDEVRELFIEKGMDFSNNDITDIVSALIKEYLAAGYAIAIDANCSRVREELEAIGKEYNAPLIWIRINPPEDFIMNKLRTYKHHGTLFKDADDAIENYKRSRDERKELDQRISYLYTFDTSKEDLPMQIKEAITKIEDALPPFSNPPTLKP